MTHQKRMRELRRAGYIVAFTGKHHLKITHPTKPGTVIMPGTPSDVRGIRNTKAQLRRVFR